jgi:glycosyltransferase involved in cell wall biosynthesis
MTLQAPIVERQSHETPDTARASTRLPMVLHTRVITGAGGGPDKTILNSPRFLGDLGYRSACVFLRPPGDEAFQVIRDRAVAAQADIEEIDDHGALDWRIVPRLLSTCRRLNVDIWHAHDYKTNALGIVLRRFHPMRLVTTSHGWVEYTPRTRLYYLCDRWSLPRYERVICVSPDIREQCCRYGVSDERAQLIENAIDTDQFRRKRSVDEAKSLLDWPPGRMLLGGAGRLSEEKGFDDLIRSVRELVDRGIDVGLIIIGEGQQRSVLAGLIHQLNLADRVRLAGFQSDLRPFYEAMDLFVLSSRREGLPNVVLEAMALEMPVVSTRVAGVPRLITDGENGLLVDLGDRPALSSAVARALGDADLRRALAKAGRSTIEQRYSFAERMKKVAAVYDELLGNTADGTPPR